jgi:hypothetical protein
MLVKYNEVELTQSKGRPNNWTKISYDIEMMAGII